MSRILAAWELGAHLGHIDRLLPVAEALRERGHELVFVLRDLSRAHPRVAARGFTMGQAPVWLPRLAHPPRLVNYARVLAEAGWLDATGLCGLLAGWQAWFDALKPDLLLADHAPTALLAARGTGLRVCSVGSSFEQPPPGPSFPPLAFWNADEAAQCAASDAQVLAPVEEALARSGRAALGRLPALFDGVPRALVTLPELAHYQGYPADTPFCGALFRDDTGVVPDWPPGPGPRVFVYLLPGHPEFAALMAALRARGLITLVHAKGLSADAAQRLGGPTLRFEAQPLRMDRTLAEADLVVSHGGAGTTAAALLAGKPQLLLPTHMEQAMTGQRLVAAGLGLSVPVPAPPPAGAGAAPHRAGPDWPHLLERLLAEPGWRERARAAAARHAGQSPQATALRAADLVERALVQG